MDPDEGDALRDLIDERAIRRLVARYSDAVASRDEATWSATWTDDAVWDMGLAKAEGRAEVVRTWKRLMGGFRLVSQLPQYGSVEVDGDRASGRWQIVELGWPASGPGSLLLGRYDDVYRRTAEGWRFQRRVLRVLYLGPPDLSGEPSASWPRA